MTVLARRALVLALAVACTSSAPPDDDPAPRSVLFIGNSLTYTNDLPAMVTQVARAAHDSVRVAMAVGGNLAVIDHTNGATDAVAQIDRGGWTFVVLQQGPTPAGVCRDTLVIAAMRLAPHIGAVGARSALFLPWPHQGHPETLQYAGASATLAARSVGGVVLPVGIAWQNAVDCRRHHSTVWPRRLPSRAGRHPARGAHDLRAVVRSGCARHSRRNARAALDGAAAARAAAPSGPVGARGRRTPVAGPADAGAGATTRGAEGGAVIPSAARDLAGPSSSRSRTRSLAALGMTPAC